MDSLEINVICLCAMVLMQLMRMYAQVMEFVSILMNVNVSGDTLVSIVRLQNALENLPLTQKHVMEMGIAHIQMFVFVLVSMMEVNVKLQFVLDLNQRIVMYVLPMVDVNLQTIVLASMDSQERIVEPNWQWMLLSLLFQLQWLVLVV
jgi:hypothetical protein